MFPSDPYAPPQARLDGPVRGGDPRALLVATVVRRFAASLLDLAFVLPVVVLEIYLSNHTRWAPLYMLVPYQLLTIFMYIVMVRRYGGSPGKLLTRLRIVMVDGSALTWKASTLRYGVYLVLGLLMSVAEILTAISLPDDTHLALDDAQQAVLLQLHTPWWSEYVLYGTMAWAGACAIVLLTNARRRALYDFQAGTMVVRKQKDAA